MHLKNPLRNVPFTFLIYRYFLTDYLKIFNYFPQDKLSKVIPCICQYIKPYITRKVQGASKYTQVHVRPLEGVRFDID